MLWLGFVLSLISCCCCSLHLTAALTPYDLLSSGSSDTSALGVMTTATTIVATDSDSWQPIPNNWLIVQTSTGLQAYDKNRSGNNKKQQQQQHTQQLYGRHATVVAPQHNLVEPYILTFSKVHTQDVSKKESYAQQVADNFYNKQRQRLAVNGGSFVVTPTTSTTTTTIGTKGSPPGQTAQEIGNRELSLDVEDALSSFTSSISPSSSSLASFPSSSSTSLSSSSSPTIIKASQQQSSNKSTTDADAEEQIIQDTDIEQRLDDLLMPYKNVLAKVKYFFPNIKNVFDVTEADAIKWPKSRKVKGHEEVLKSAATSTTTISVGSSRKLKQFRKLRKFMLPLLLAYKLKFLMLIPLLIGGLTLLVGTTGLAGFFFALFTAVMSLKTSGEPKSLVVKKFH